jgi:hypothetical protein
MSTELTDEELQELLTYRTSSPRFKSNLDIQESSGEVREMSEDELVQSHPKDMIKIAADICELAKL